MLLKKIAGIEGKRMIASYINSHYKVSISRACQLSSLARSNYYREKQRKSFMSDALIGGIKSRILNVIDDYHRKGIGIAVAFSMPATFVTEQLGKWCAIHGYPEMIRTDNGPEFISAHFQNWAKQHNIQLRHIQLGKPAQNGFIERFNRTYREDVLDANQFTSLQEVEAITQPWLIECNTIRPHQALANLPPEKFAANILEIF